MRKPYIHIFIYIVKAGRAAECAAVSSHRLSCHFCPAAGKRDGNFLNIQVLLQPTQYIYCDQMSSLLTFFLCSNRQLAPVCLEHSCPHSLLLNHTLTTSHANLVTKSDASVPMETDQEDSHVMGLNPAWKIQLHLLQSLQKFRQRWNQCRWMLQCGFNTDTICCLSDLDMGSVFWHRYHVCNYDLRASCWTRILFLKKLLTAMQVTSAIQLCLAWTGSVGLQGEGFSAGVKRRVSGVRMLVGSWESDSGRKQKVFILLAAGLPGDHSDLLSE